MHNIASIGMPFSFVTFSVHRLCSVTYHIQSTSLTGQSKRFSLMGFENFWNYFGLYHTHFLSKSSLDAEEK
jgi:hypothetical protein